MDSRSGRSCEETVLEKPVEVARVRRFVAKALAPETGRLMHPEGSRETTREPDAPSRAADLEDVPASCQSRGGLLCRCPKERTDRVRHRKEASDEYSGSQGDHGISQGHLGRVDQGHG